MWWLRTKEDPFWSLLGNRGWLISTTEHDISQPRKGHSLRKWPGFYSIIRCYKTHKCDISAKIWPIGGDKPLLPQLLLCQISIQRLRPKTSPRRQNGADYKYNCSSLKPLQATSTESSIQDKRPLTIQVTENTPLAKIALHRNQRTCECYYQIQCTCGESQTYSLLPYDKDIQVNQVPLTHPAQTCSDVECIYAQCRTSRISCVNRESSRCDPDTQSCRCPDVVPPDNHDDTGI